SNNTATYDLPYSDSYTTTYNSNNQPVEMVFSYSNAAGSGATTYNATYTSEGYLQMVSYVRSSSNIALNGSGTYNNIVYSGGNIISFQNSYTQDITGNTFIEYFSYEYYDKENSPIHDPRSYLTPFQLRMGDETFSIGIESF